ncbi:hypothetical protein JVT61DRAFT_10959 [Boletus reticuloceps]|uniref:Galactokinase n=1 Tax=Boletus reticuloceps TaxID=495285 RepID=A0A8I2YF67_9AGAM|nr:hypothetical protein JVT61DRAFT_10959 [Boletus reticuloceps]
MPGPRAKQNSGKLKNKPKGMSQRDAAPGTTSSSPIILTTLLNTLDGLSSDDWDKVAKVLCDHFKLPDLGTRSGLKKVYHNFAHIYKQINDTYVANEANELIRGGITAIYVKMCADSVLRNMLFHQEGLLDKIIALINKPNTRHLALRALTTITQHGGSDIRKEILQHTPVMIKLLQDFSDDLYAAELAITIIAHAVTCTLDEPQTPPAKYIKMLQLPKLIPLVLGFVDKPCVTLPLLHHALELFGNLTHHCPQDCLTFPDMIDFLIAYIRSADMHSRFYALGAVIRLHSPKPERLVSDPYALIAAVKRGLPDHLTDILLDYGPMRCESSLILQSFADYQKAMMQCAQDRDMYKLGLTLAELIPRNEYSISEGGFQAINERTGRAELMDVGLPFKMWVDALPICAKVIREKGKAGEEHLADMLDMKFFVIRSRIPEAIMIAKKGIERNPKLPYPYYIMTLGDDVEESTVGDQKWEQGQAFMSSTLDDARIYLAQAPPDMRHRKSILYWYIVLTLVEKGPELSTDLHEFKKYTDMLKIADEFFAEFGVVPPKSQLSFAHEHISSRYAAATKKWGTAVAQLDSHSIDEFILSRDRAEDRLAAWLDDIQDEDGNDSGGQQPERSLHPKRSKNNPSELHRCSWCGNPSAVLLFSRTQRTQSSKYILEVFLESRTSSMAATLPIPVYTSLEDVYHNLGTSLKHAERWDSLAKEFEAKFGRTPAYIARAPGREHIDYSLFGVFPAAIEHDILIACAPRTLTNVNDHIPGHVVAENLQRKYPRRVFSPTLKPSVGPLPKDAEVLDDAVHVDAWHLDIHTTPLGWEGYVKAGYYGVLNHYFNPELNGPDSSPIPVDLLVTGTVPAGSGLSSSAAMVVSSTLAFLAVNGILEDPSIAPTKGTLVEMAVENEKRVGAMDQAASVISLAGSALYVSFFPKLSAETIPLPGPRPEYPSCQSATLVCANSLVVSDKAVHAKYQYNLRVVESLGAARVLAVRLGVNVDPRERITLREVMARHMGEPQHQLEENVDKVKEGVAADGEGGRVSAARRRRGRGSARSDAGDHD